MRHTDRRWWDEHSKRRRESKKPEKKATSALPPTRLKSPLLPTVVEIAGLEKSKELAIARIRELVAQVQLVCSYGLRQTQANASCTKAFAGQLRSSYYTK